MYGRELILMYSDLLFDLMEPGITEKAQHQAYMPILKSIAEVFLQYLKFQLLKCVDQTFLLYLCLKTKFIQIYKDASKSNSRSQ